LEFQAGEFTGSMTPEALIDAMTKGGIVIPPAEFSVGDLEIPDLLNSLQGNRQDDKTVLQKLGLDADTVKTVATDDLVNRLNAVLLMKDFHSSIAADSYKSSLDEEIQNILTRAKANDNPLTDQDYKRLNRALLEAIYPHEIQKSPETQIKSLNKLLEDQNLYKAMEKQPYDVSTLISRRKDGQQLSPLEIKRLNRALIEANYPKTPKMEEASLEFQAGEFTGSMTPKALLEAMKRKGGVRIPIPDNPIESLNKLLEHQDLYEDMNVWPADTRALIDRRAYGQQLSLLEIKHLNRALIEANYPLETPKRKEELGKIIDPVGKINFLDRTQGKIQDNDWNKVRDVMNKYLGIGVDRINEIIGAYKEFKTREGMDILPIHPLNIRIFRYLPHFIFSNVAILIWFNAKGAGASLMAFLVSLITAHLIGIVVISILILAGIVFEYKYRSLKANRYGDNTFKIKEEWFSQQLSVFKVLSYIFRTAGFATIVGGIILQLLHLPLTTPQQALLGLIALIFIMELAGMWLPLIWRGISEWLEKKVSIDKTSSGILKRLNNRSFFSSTRPVSIIGLSLKYHFKPQIPSGGFWGMLGAIVFYVGLFAGFITFGGYLGVEVFHLFLHGQFVLGGIGGFIKIIAGATMLFIALYLLRYGIGVALTSFATLFVTFPVRTIGLALSLLYIFTTPLGVHPIIILAITALFFVGMLFEEKIKENFIYNKKRLNRKFLHFATSTAFWRKIRETWAHIAWFAAFPRWSGGLFQKMNDKIMQDVSELGPLSVFAREVR
jgi:hypothetical protein